MPAEYTTDTPDTPHPLHLLPTGRWHLCLLGPGLRDRPGGTSAWRSTASSTSAS